MNRQNMNKNIRPVGGADKRNNMGAPKTRRPAPQSTPQQRRPAESHGWVMPERPPTARQQNLGKEAGYTQMPLRPLTSMPRRDARDVAATSYRSFNHPAEQRMSRVGQAPHRTRPAAQAPQRQAPQSAPQRRSAPPSQKNGEAMRQRIAQPQRPANGAPQSRTAPPPQQRRRPEPQRRPQNSGWVIPEGSAVYTAQGKMYEPRTARPEDRRTRVQKGPNQPPRRNLRPNKPRPKEKKKIFNKEKFFLYTKTFFVRLAVMLLCVSILGLWWYRAEFHSTPKQRSGEVLCTFPDVGEYTSKASQSYFSDVLYVDFTEVSEWFGMVSVGSVSCMRFICPNGPSQTSAGNGGEEYAIFTDDSTTVLINGTVVILEAKCRTQGSHIWIPLSFVENYVNGVSCNRSAKGTEITFSVPGAEDADPEEIQVNASFKVKAQNALAHVEYPD